MSTSSSLPSSSLPAPTSPAPSSTVISPVTPTGTIGGAVSRVLALLETPTPLTPATLFDVIVQAAVIALTLPGVTVETLTPLLAATITTIIQSQAETLGPNQVMILTGLVSDYLPTVVSQLSALLPKVEQEVESACGACWKLCCPCFASK